MRKLDTIIVHHTVTTEYATQAQVEEMHAKRGISRPGGYHFLLRRDEVNGRVRVVGLRPVEKVGAHDKGQNTGSIGIALAGDFTRHHLETDTWVALCNLVASLKHSFPTITKVEGHRENELPNTPTLCPGFPAASLNEVLDGRWPPTPEADYTRSL